MRMPAIRNADEVHVADSSFYCLARYLPLKACVKICYDRETGKPSEMYKFTPTVDPTYEEFETTSNGTPP
jgi:hypothetical protein